MKKLIFLLLFLTGCVTPQAEDYAKVTPEHHAFNNRDYNDSSYDRTIRICGDEVTVREYLVLKENFIPRYWKENGEMKCELIRK